MRRLAEWWDETFGWCEWWEQLIIIALGVLIVALAGSIPIMCENSRKQEALVDACLHPELISSRISVSGGSNNMPVFTTTYYMYECADGSIVESSRSPMELKAKMKK